MQRETFKKSPLEKRFWNLFLTLLFFVGNFLIIRYNLVTYKGIFQSDSASANILAREIIDKRSPISKDWFYVNSDFSFMGPATFVAFFYPLGFSSYTTHALGMILSAFLIQASLFVLSSLVYKEFNRKILFTLAFFGTLSIPNADQLLGEGAYTLLIVATILNIFLIHSIFNGIRTKYTNVILMIVCFVSFVAAMNSFTKVISFILVPVFVLFALQICRDKSVFLKIDKKNISIMVTNYFGIFIGGIGNIFLGKLLTNSNSVLSFNFRDASQSFQGIGQLFDSITWGLGINPGSEFSASSIFAPLSMVRVLFAIILVTSVIQAIKGQGCCNRLEFVLAIFVLSPFMTNAFLLTFTRVGVDVSTFRYLLVPLIVCAILTIYKIEQDLKMAKSFPVFLAFLAGVIACFPNLLVGKQDSLFNSEKILAELKLRNIDSIYSTYWNAGKLEVLSNETIRFLPITFSSQNCIEPFKWLTTQNRVKPLESEIPLLLTNLEWENIENSSCNSKIIIEENLGDFVIAKSREE